MSPYTAKTEANNTLELSIIEEEMECPSVNLQIYSSIWQSHELQVK